MKLLSEVNPIFFYVLKQRPSIAARSCVGVVRLLFVWLLLSSSANATVPVELQSLFEAKNPYAEGEFTFAWMDVYRIALWTDQQAWQTNTRYALSIVYEMAFSADELVDRTCDEMARHHPQGKDMCLAHKDQLKRMMPNVSKGDRITALHLESGHARFYKNGILTGEIKDAVFTQTFFAVWLGDNTSEPQLRRQLLRQE